MIPIETRYNCPVCLGVTLKKYSIEGKSEFFIDHCSRCGGVWFDSGELHRLRQCSPQDLWNRIAQREGVHVMQCHSCDQLLERDGRKCPACGWSSVLRCPVCDVPMESAQHTGVLLDACPKCKGIWFDHHELAAIWRVEFLSALQRRRVPASVEAGGAVVEALAYDPFATYLLVDAAGHALSAGAQGVAGASGIAEAASDAAASVFEAIVEIIGGFFG